MEFLIAPLVPILGLLFLLFAERLEQGLPRNAPADVAGKDLAPSDKVAADV